ncbi:MAG: UDP-3-O-(3-hydroxymyristoyl)glucosamine N-acyltransferase [Gammaproteobacteria bacterium]|nr:UDP-3-O-(3-hydroxymyristoyl)glucosamine N-acyltransferase [Gammaproteobacteria bacterium]
MTSLSLIEAADLVGGLVEGESDQSITGVNTLAKAGETELSFLANQRYKGGLSTCRAAAVLLSKDEENTSGCCVIRVADPYLAFARLQRHFYPEPKASGSRHSSAVIDPSADLADDVDVGANVVIGAKVSVGAGSRIGPGCVLSDHVLIGKHCLLHANVVIGRSCILKDGVIVQPGAVIGSDGFGYAWDGQQHLKIPQVGRVVLEEGVEVGANTCIDRGAIGDTVIEHGVKLDNQIQIAHNVRVGAFTVMASQVGISGSTDIGSGCQFGGQAGVAGHLNIGDGCKLAGQTGVLGDLEAGGVYGGSPALPYQLWLRVSALTKKLPEIWKSRNR